MAKVIFECDGCGLKGVGFWAGTPPAAHKPHSWFQRSDGDGVQIACSRACIEKIAEKTGKTSVVLPI